MAFLKKNAVLIGVVAAAAGIFYLYSNFFSQSSLPPLTTEAISPVTSDLLVTLASVTGITLNEKIFTDPVFTSLSDFGVVIPPQAVGRRNPFAPAP